MKVIVLAYDGLEYSLIFKWKLKTLLQVKYGLHKSVYNNNGEILTPVVWTSFITGKDPVKHGINSWIHWGKYEIIRRIPPFKWIKGKRIVAQKLGIKPRLPMKKDIRYKTIFEQIKSIPLYIPAYNEPEWIHQALSNAMKKGIDSFSKVAWMIHNMREKTYWDNLKKFIEEDYDLMMIWFDIADLIGHLCISKCRLQLLKVYMKLASIVSRTNDIIDNNTLLLVVSDHGMKPNEYGIGKHSEYGFWSINKNLEWFNPKYITDFYSLIFKVLRL